MRYCCGLWPVMEEKRVEKLLSSSKPTWRATSPTGKSVRTSSSFARVIRVDNKNCTVLCPYIAGKAAKPAFADRDLRQQHIQIDGLRIMCTDIICNLLDHGPVGTAFVPGKLLVGKQCQHFVQCQPNFDLGGGGFLFHSANSVSNKGCISMRLTCAAVSRPCDCTQSANVLTPTPSRCTQ